MTKYLFTLALPATADEMRALPPTIEMRTAALDEIRAVTDGTVTIRGHAAVFDSPSVDMGGWYEVIKRGAFRKVLATNPDVRLLVNHEGLPLARTANGTLTLREDATGLAFEADLPDTSLARDVAALLERGDLSQMSFAFRADPESVEWTVDDDGRERREVGRISLLREGSLVTFPAYEATDAEIARSAPAPETETSHQDDVEGQHDGEPVEGTRNDTASTVEDAPAGVTGLFPVAAKRRRFRLAERQL